MITFVTVTHLGTKWFLEALRTTADTRYKICVIPSNLVASSTLIQYWIPSVSINHSI